MFDLGFWELLLILIVALLVIGPERLPTVARQAGMWFGKAKRFVSSVQRDINEELHTEELRRVMKDAEISEELQQTTRELKESAREMRRQVKLDDSAEETGEAADSSGKSAVSKPGKIEAPAAEEGKDTGADRDAGRTRTTHESEG